MFYGLNKATYKITLAKTIIELAADGENEVNWDELSNSIRDIYIQNGYKRTNLTGNIDFLKGYQGNVCFYCGEPINQFDAHVDYFLPKQFIQHDEIWNLVLSHSTCNLNKNVSLVGEHYFLKLIARNENILGSNHPWKKKINDSLGSTSTKRAKTMHEHYSNAKVVLRGKLGFSCIISNYS